MCGGTEENRVTWAGVLNRSGILSPGIKRPGREADHSPPSSA